MNQIVISILTGVSTTVLLTLLGMGWNVYRQLRNLPKEISDLKRHQHKNYMAILRLSIVSDEMPVSERIAAGDQYLKLGGNGAIKKLYQELVNEHKI